MNVFVVFVAFVITNSFAYVLWLLGIDIISTSSSIIFSLLLWSFVLLPWILLFSPIASLFIIRLKYWCYSVYVCCYY